VVTTKATTPVHKTFTEEEIRAKANEIYLERLKNGTEGTAEGDWNKAIDVLKKLK